jgi:MFS family permease
VQVDLLGTCQERQDRAHDLGREPRAQQVTHLLDALDARGVVRAVTVAPCPRRTGLPLAGLLALATAVFTDVMTDLLPAAALPQTSRSLGVSQGQVGFLVSGYAVASGVAAIPLATALRSFRRRPVLLAALAGFALFNAVAALSPSYALTFVARLLAGSVGGLLWAILVPYAARMVPAPRKGQAIAIVLAGITVALALGVPAGSALASVVGWRAVFAVLAVLAAALVAWAQWKVPDHAVLLVGVGLWGMAFGGAPALIQTALVGVAGPGNTDVATAMQQPFTTPGSPPAHLRGAWCSKALGRRRCHGSPSGW